MARSRPSRRPDAAAGKPEQKEATGPRTAIGKVADVAAGQQERRVALIHAPNWRTPLIIDISIGVAVLLAGLTLSIVWNPIGGGGLGALGALYALLAVRRWRVWAALRAAAPSE